MKSNLKSVERRIRRLTADKTVYVHLYKTPKPNANASTVYSLKHIDGEGFFCGYTLRGLLVATERGVLDFYREKGFDPSLKPYVFEATLEELSLTLEQAISLGFLNTPAGQLTLPHFLSA